MASSRQRRIPTESDPLLQERSIIIDPSQDDDEACQRAAAAQSLDPDLDSALHDTPDVVQPSRKWIVEPAALMFCAGMLGQASVMTQYLYFRVGQQHNETLNSTRAFVCDSSAPVNASEHLLTSSIQGEASQWTLYRNLASSVIALLLLPVFASSSDYLGRKPALLIPCIGMALDAVGLLLVVMLDLPLLWTVVSGGVGALGGGFGALFAAIFAYLADTTTRQERPVRVAIVEGTLGLAACIMELVIGWWIHLMGYTAPMAFCAAVTLANLLYIACLVPEVRLKRQTVHSGHLGALLSPFTNIVGLFRTSARLAVTLGLLLAAIGVYSASFIGSSIVSSLYQMNYPFCLDSIFIGYLNAAKIVGFQVGVAIGLLVLRRCLGLKPLGLTIVGLLSAMIGAVATGMAGSASMLFAAAAFALFSMLPIPMLRAFTSQIAPADRQGALFSCIGVLEISGNLAGSAAFTVIYQSSQAWMPGFVYLAVFCTTLVAMVLTCACAFIDCCCPMPKVVGTVGN